MGMRLNMLPPDRLSKSNVFQGFWEHDPTPRIGKFSRCFIQNWEKLTPYNIIKFNKKSNIWSTNEHILTFGTQKYNLLWHSAVKISQNGDHFFPLKLGKKTFFLPLGA